MKHKLKNNLPISWGIHLKRRNPYQRLSIESITRSELIKDQEGRWRLVLSNGNYIYRVWIMGIVTERYSGDNNYIGLKIEDGTSNLIAKSWNGKLDNFHQWDKVEILGQVQISEKGEEIDVFLSPDLINFILDDNWFLVHRLKIAQQLQKTDTRSLTKSAKISGVEIGIVSIEELKNELIKTVRELDSGKGVSYDQLVKLYPNIDEEQIDGAITELLESGEFFEPRAGVYSSAIDS
ncbi:MAG: OB-fold nucleic acid binding domain-containing protein [Candidatus Hodarchaeota archaeon]